MSALVYVFPFLIFRPAIAAPTGLQTLASTVPGVLGPLLQPAVDFLDPHHSPSLKQTVISCLTLLSVSIFIICPASNAKVKRAGISKLRYGMTVAFYGLLSQDFLVFVALRNVFRDFFVAVGYNIMFRTEDRKKKWTGAHVAFLSHGGFVLQEDGGPTKVLSFDDLVRMIKAGEVERPDVSRADVLAKSIRPSIPRRILNYLFYIPLYWFIKKFTFKLPLVVVFVVLHALLTWVILVLRSSTTTGIKEPIVVVRKSREETNEETPSRDDIDKLEGVFESKAFVDPADDEKVAEEISVAADFGEKDNVQSAAPSPDQTRHRSLGSSVEWLLAFPFKVIGLVFDVLFQFLAVMCSASTLSLKYQWAIIRGPCRLTTFGSYVAIMLENFLAWIGFVVLSWQVPFDVERKIWIVSSLFLFLQPLVLLLARPQRIRMRIKESIREVIYVSYALVCVVARLSIPIAALYSARSAV